MRDQEMIEMMKISQDEINKIVEQHELWLSSGGEDGARADLRYSNLRNSDLRDSTLRDSNLSYSDLRNSNLSNSNLRDSNLRGSNLRGSNLSQTRGIIEASVSWTDHGEKGRRLQGVVIDETPIYFCGCFSGTGDELQDYIDKGCDDLAESRQLAYDFVRSRLEEGMENGN